MGTCWDHGRTQGERPRQSLGWTHTKAWGGCKHMMGWLYCLGRTRSRPYAKVAAAAASCMGGKTAAASPVTQREGSPHKEERIDR